MLKSYKFISFFCLLSILFVSCNSKTETTIPVLTTTAISSITTISAISGGTITFDGGSSITGRGVCWSTKAKPTIADSKTNDSIGTGSFTSSIAGLQEGTIYYVRAYATNSLGTAYGNEVRFTPLNVFNPNFNYGSVNDIDGNVYKTIKIGTQTWMAENLRTTKYNDGTAIPAITDNTTAWGNLSTPAYCWYDNDADIYKNTYGALYNWYAVHTGKLAPTGWHVPTDSEWKILESYLIANGYNYDGSTSGNYCAKSLASNTNWAVFIAAGAVGNDLSKNNRTGFSAQPAGFRDNDADGLGQFTYWWSSTEDNPNDAINRHLNFYGDNLHPGYSGKSRGNSVRCVKDN